MRSFSDAMHGLSGAALTGCTGSRPAAAAAPPCGSDDGTGFEGPGCNIDINECARQTAGCSPEAACLNTRGSFTCTCHEGYTGGSGTSCQPTPALAGVEAQYSTEGRARLACDEGSDIVYPEGAPGFAYDLTGALEGAADGGRKVRSLV